MITIYTILSYNTNLISSGLSFGGTDLIIGNILLLTSSSAVLLMSNSKSPTLFDKPRLSPDPPVLVDIELVDGWGFSLKHKFVEKNSRVIEIYLDGRHINYVIFNRGLN